MTFPEGTGRRSFVIQFPALMQRQSRLSRMRRTSVRRGEALRQLQDSGLERPISACQITLKARITTLGFTLKGSFEGFTLLAIFFLLFRGVTALKCGSRSELPSRELLAHHTTYVQKQTSIHTHIQTNLEWSFNQTPSNQAEHSDDTCLCLTETSD